MWFTHARTGTVRLRVLDIHLTELSPLAKAVQQHVKPGAIENPSAATGLTIAVIFSLCIWVAVYFVIR